VELRETKKYGEVKNRKKRKETKQQLIETVRIERNACHTKENNRFGGYFERRIHTVGGGG